MGGRNTCSIPGCRTDRKKQKIESKTKISLFSPPKNAELFEKWQKAIPFENFVLTHKDKVCMLHFREDEFEQYYTTILPDGTVHKIERGRFKLNPEAVPSIFITRIDSSETKRKFPNESILTEEFTTQIQENIATTSSLPTSIATTSSLPITITSISSLATRPAAISILRPRVAVTSSPPTRVAVTSSPPTRVAVTSSPPTRVAVTSILPTQAATASNLPTQAATASNLPTQAATASNLPTRAAVVSILPKQAATTPVLSTRAAITSVLPTRPAAISILRPQVAATSILPKRTAATSVLATRAAVTPVLPTRAAVTPVLPTRAAVTPVLPTRAATTPVLPTRIAATSVLPTQTAIDENTSMQDLTLISENLSSDAAEDTLYSFQDLLKELTDIVIPNDFWGVTRTSSFVLFSRFDGHYTLLKKVVIEHDLNVKIFLQEWEVKVTGSKNISCIKDITILLNAVEKIKICKGANNKSMTDCLIYLSTKRFGPAKTWCNNCITRRKINNSRLKIKRTCLDAYVLQKYVPKNIKRKS